MTVPCLICKKPINPHDVSSWKEVTGFVGGPKKDSMVLRKDTGNFACTPCIHKERQGQAPDQDTLFAEPATPASVGMRVDSDDWGPEDIWEPLEQGDTDGTR
jgi:hypothetical protein